MFERRNDDDDDDDDDDDAAACDILLLLYHLLIHLLRNTIETNIIGIDSCIWIHLLCFLLFAY